MSSEQLSTKILSEQAKINHYIRGKVTEEEINRYIETLEIFMIYLYI